jgi:hypothetical protein
LFSGVERVSFAKFLQLFKPRSFAARYSGLTEFTSFHLNQISKPACTAPEEIRDLDIDHE